MRTALIGLLSIGLSLAGCAAASDTTGPGPAGFVDFGTGMIKQPPLSIGGGATAPGCDGVTAKGRCEPTSSGREVVVSCDTIANQVVRIDCTAIGKHCLLDTHKGATCVDLNGAPVGEVQPPPLPPIVPSPTPAPSSAPHPSTAPAMSDMGVPRCPTGVSYDGFCLNGTAIWCDTTTGQTIQWNCGQDGLSCQTNTCASGSFCCTDPNAPPTADLSPPPSPSANPECDALGFNGVCNGNSARWCDGGEVYTLDCAAYGDTCQVDTCATGAYCCAPMSVAPVDMGTDDADGTLI